MTPVDRKIAAGLFLLTFVTYAYFFSGGGWNQNAHLDLTRALVEQRTVAIDSYWSNTGDVSWSRSSGEEHVYINKPPGVSFLAAVPYALLYGLERALRLPGNTWEMFTLNAWLVTALTCGLTGALIPVVLYCYGRRHAGASPLAALGVALVIAFGTIVFPYATMLFAHVPPALFLLVAFVWRDERPLLAGIAAGIAGASYYLCIPAAMVMFAGVWFRGGIRLALRFAAGGLPFGVLLMIYHTVCFGSPLVTSLEVSTRFTEKGLILGVFRLPATEALWGLLGSDYRGLFFFSPVLLLALVGAWRMRRSELVLVAAIVAVFVVAASAFNQWPGGSAFGPRYLLPAVPFFGMAMMYLRGRLLGTVALVLGIFSCAVHLLATAVDPTPNDAIRDPLRDYLLPHFLAGATSINEQSIAERFPHARYPRGSHESAWASFNLGELLTGPSNTASLLPLVIWILGGGALLARRAAVP